MDNITLILDNNQLNNYIGETIGRAINNAFEDLNILQTATRLLSKHEVTEKLGIGYASLNKLIANGEIITTTDGKISELELIRYLKTTTKKEGM